MKSTRNAVAFAVLAATVSLVATPDADAKGCNGVVNASVWGCAPWDNNNGPQFPNYKKKPAASPVAKPTVATPRPVAPPSQVVKPNAGAPIISGGAGNIVSGGSGNIISGGAGNMKNK